MLGSLTPLSRFQLPPHLTNQPTRAEVNWINDFFSITLLTTDWPWPLGACGVKSWSLHTGTLRSRLPLPQVVLKLSVNTILNLSFYSVKAGGTRRVCPAAMPSELKHKNSKGPGSLKGLVKLWACCLFLVLPGLQMGSKADHNPHAN